ncbi:O-methyltransferase [uncultured Erythrobacter sp.]|uniref:O-methyltransferase n=1 Tax=uncultured Erythrobacter sp. TaxID=263913 RepID=UPI0026291C57|nr:class I SAM-dependent methyltransferase [uncultured Erythrobacter sp.]
MEKEKYNIKELRGYSVALIIQYLASKNKLGLNIFEIGSAYSRNQGVSTAQLADFAFQHGHNFSTVDIEPDHTAASKANVRQICGAEAEEHADFYTCDSLDALKDLEEKQVKLDFAYIDGGNDPLQNLREFQKITSLLKPDGIILIDDLQEINSPDGYPAPRPMGKATLIIPYVILAQHQAREAPNGMLEKFESSFEPKNFYIQVRMLAYGPDEFLKYYKDCIKQSGTKTGIHF